VEEVVVTSRRRAERLQKVPVAVTVLGAAAIAQNKVVSVNNLGQLAPSLTFQESSYQPFGSFVGIRGIKSSDTVLSQSPSVGIYVDDVYAPSTIGTGAGNLDDTRQIEVLKGPQGTLYGRNTTGGAVRINTNPPDYSGIYGSARVGFGNYGSNEDAVMINAPIIKDKVALRVNYERIGHDGYGYDAENHRSLDSIDSESFRAALKVDPTEDFDITFRGNVLNAHSTGLIDNLDAIKPVFGADGKPTFSAALLNTGLEIGSLTFGELLPFLAPQLGLPITPANYAAVIAGQEAAYAALAKNLKSGYTVHNSFPQYGNVRDDGGSINAAYHINDDLTVRSITSYQYLYQSDGTDLDASPYVVLEGPGSIQSTDQFTQELQVVGKALDEKLNYTAGFYYYYMTGLDNSPGEAEVPFLNPSGFPVLTNDRLTDKSYAFFSQGTYTLTPTVHVTGGVRWTNEDTGLTGSSTTGAARNCNVPPPAGVDGQICSDTFTNAFHAFDYLASIDWSVTDNILLYAKTSRGFRAGGQNQRGSVVGGFAPFAPEQVTSYEIGIKSDLLDHKIRLNSAAYHTIYKDIQRSVLAVLPDEETVTEIVNAAGATIDGVEVEATARPIPPLVLMANGAYTHPKYTSYYSDGVNLSNNAFTSQPLWQLNFGGTYTYPLTIANIDASVVSTVNFSYQSKENLYPDNESVYSPYVEQGGYGLLDARVALNIPKYGVVLEGWGKNLLNRKYLTSAVDVTNSLGVGTAYLSDPRTFGFSLTKRF
jgi:iron complex outermembrane receptor protein